MSLRRDQYPRISRIQAITPFLPLPIPGVPIPRNFAKGLSLGAGFFVGLFRTLSATLTGRNLKIN